MLENHEPFISLIFQFFWGEGGYIKPGITEPADTGVRLYVCVCVCVCVCIYIYIYAGERERERERDMRVFGVICDRYGCVCENWQHLIYVPCQQQAILGD